MSVVLKKQEQVDVAALNLFTVHTYGGLFQFPFPFETKVKVMVRQLEVTVPGQPVHTCMHYHWMDWPDRGVPEADLAPIALLAKLKENTWVLWETFYGIQD